MGRPAKVQGAIVDFLKKNNGKATINIEKFEIMSGFSNTGIRHALNILVERSVIKKSTDGVGVGISTEYTLIGDIVVSSSQAREMPRRKNVFKSNGDLLQRAMEQVVTLKATQEHLLAVLEENKELKARVQRLEKQVVDQKQELDATDTQLAEEQKKFFELVQAVEKNSKMIKKINFDGRGIQRTAGI